MYGQGIDVNYPKEVIKQAFNKETLPDGQVWINMLNARNATSHEYNLEKVMIYGSRAKGTYRIGSDSDFAIWSDKDSLMGIPSELDELPTPYMFDVINYKDLSDEPIKSSIDRDGKLFYQRD